MPNDPRMPLVMFPKLQAAFRGMGDAFPYFLAEKYPRLLGRIEMFWGSRETLKELNGLLFSDRFDRQGFSEEIVAELTLLVQLHEEQFPEASARRPDPFYRHAVDHCGVDPSLVSKVVRNRALRESGAVAEPAAPTESAAHATPTRQRRESTLAASEATTQPRWHEIRHIEEFRIYCDLRSKRVLASYPRDARALGELLVSRGVISREVLARALRIQRMRSERRKNLGAILMEMKAATADDVMRALCVQSGIPMVNLSSFQVPPEMVDIVRPPVARLKRALPVAVLGNFLFLAVDNPFQFGDRNYFTVLCNREIVLVYAPAGVLSYHLDNYGQVRTREAADREFRDLAQKAFNGRPALGAAPACEPERIQVADDDATVIGLVNKMIEDAGRMGASDIHIEAFPANSHTRIRFRRDGALQNYSEFPSAYHEAVICRIKVMADLDISERRRAQDGKISRTRAGVAMDLRVATIPTVRNVENVCIRLLPCGKPMRLEELGLAGDDLKRMRSVADRPFGLILVCGPTGSGKTTTLHSVLHEINSEQRKIWTAEDPVEIVQENICQVQVNSRIGWTFAAALRSFLRADPDVIMIGEMRDAETAKIALEASMTGHLVLSTLHTNSAGETAARLVEMGADPLTLSDALLGVLAQRLAQRLCAKCVAPGAEYTRGELEELAAEYLHSGRNGQASAAERDALIQTWKANLGNNGSITRWSAKGCEACGGTGYRGRVGLYELAIFTPEMRQMVRRQLPGSELEQAARAGGMRAMRQDGIIKVLRGLTDIRQVRGACM
ncbi:MAG TPA: GspE/PulE family protein [Burkholderiales bacterium]|nr:GspE/PulE family protein [Burkholderiales bacterium]